MRSEKPIADADAREDRGVYGLLAQFESAAGLLKAAAGVRDGGYTRWDAYSPYPMHGLDAAMGARPTRLPWIVLILGLHGLLGGLLLVWWTNATSFGVPSFLQGYPYIVSGKPVFSLPANIPVIFETTVLLSAFGAVFGMLALNRLPRLHHPLFRSPAFRRVTADRFFIAIEAVDPRYDAAATRKLLESLGASMVEQVED